jgi:cell division septum initiation protein DivIVA
LVLPEDDTNALAEQVRQAREQLEEKFRAQAEQLQKLEHEVKELREQHEQLKSEIWHRLATLEKSELSSWGEATAPSIAQPLPPSPAVSAIEEVAPVGPPPAESLAELPGAGAAIGSAPAPGPVSGPAIEAQEAVGVLPAPAPGAGLDFSQLSEAEQKTHQDARRFARLLVNEIELYNKAKVAEGRANKDLYKRMKVDIDRSRQAFAQRFGKSVGKQFDYFHEELVKILAGDDPSLLGSDYPGPSV